MKTFYLLIASLLFTCLQSNAQTWQWTHPEANPDASSSNYAHDVEVDSSGNVYVLGGYWDSLYLGGNFIAKGYGSYIAKYNPAGTLLWYKLITANPSNAGTYPDIFASDMVVNANGIFITGRYVPTSYYNYDCNTHIFSGTYLHYQIGDFNFTSSYNELGFFLTRFNTNGAVVWNKLGTYDVCVGSAGAGAFGSNANITSDKNGNISASFILGSNNLSSISVGGDSIPIQSGYTIGQLVVVKYNSNGVFKLSAYAGGFLNAPYDGTGYIRDCNSTVADNNGNVFFYGTAKDSTYFGSQLFRTSTPPTETSYFTATFIAKLSSNGVWQFAKELYNGSTNTLRGSIGNVTGTPDLLTADGDNNVYALVNAGGTLILGDTIEHGGNFLVKMTNSGSLVWTKFFGLPTEPYCSSICYYNNNLYLNGSIRSSNSLSYSFSDLYTKFYSIYNYGYFQSFVAKADLDGNFQWVTSVGGNDNVWGWGIKAYQDYIYTCGVYNYDITNLGNLNSPYPTAAYSIFFGKLKDQYIRVGAVTPTALIPGCTVSIPFTSYGLTFSPKNKFFAELSNVNGDFSSVTTIGYTTSTGTGTITARIPATLTYSSGYRIRIRSSDTLATGYNYYAYADTGYALSLVCPPPSSGFAATNITGTSATLNWTAVGCASGYRIQYRVKGTTAWTTAATVTGNTPTYNLTGLTANTTYQWRIATKCKNNAVVSFSAYTIAKQFKTTAGFTSAVVTEDLQLQTTGLTVYPNPAKQTATVQFNAAKAGTSIIELTDLTGRVLYKTNITAIHGTNRQNINLGNLAAGMYMVTLTQPGETKQSLKINKE